jgi:hypothetical protein
MQLTIIAPASTTAAAPTAELTWVSKGGSSINSADGRYQLRKNSKGEWKINEDGKTVATGLLTKDAAKAYAVTLATHATQDVKADLAAGKAHVYSVREDGTLRRRHYLVGASLASAQAVQGRREAGESMGAIAKSMHVSVSAVRRILVDLAITQELAELEADGLAALLYGAQDAN